MTQLNKKKIINLIEDNINLRSFEPIGSMAHRKTAWKNGLWNFGFNGSRTHHLTRHVLPSYLLVTWNFFNEEGIVLVFEANMLIIFFWFSD